ncbi:MAG: hypothetical protein ACR2RL_21485, partial [Gammaproteobacteria bacterium]
MKELHGLEGWKDTGAELRDSLDGTDLDVFEALDVGNHAKADVLRMMVDVRSARGRGKAQGVNKVLERYSRGAGAEQWGGTAVSAADRRAAIHREFALMQGIDLDALQRDTQGIESERDAAAQAFFGHVTRDMTVERHTERHTYTVDVPFGTENSEYARALIFHGDGSAEARAAGLAVENVRPGGPNLLNVDRFLVFEGLNPNAEAPNEAMRAQMRDAALAERERMFRIFAQRHGTESRPGVSNQDILSDQLVRAFGNDKAAAIISQRLVYEDHPSPKTAAKMMHYAIDGAGTNNEMIDRVLPRMNREEIADMELYYPGDLRADLGIFGHGWFGDLSGDDRLRAEVQWLGRPRNAQERAEVELFRTRQQREETGWLGSALASGSMAERFLQYEEKRLKELSGGRLHFTEEGEPIWREQGRFDAEGKYTGEDQVAFESSLIGSRLAAENYAAKIDQYANAASLGIAVVGAIVAAAATVLTGGAASPLLLAAIAGITGLASMGAQRAISGGRYGWEQASVDLGMTAVDALTAGLGQSLSLASRGGRVGLRAGMATRLSIRRAQRLAAGKVLGEMKGLTDNAYLDKLLIGMITGGVGSLGRTALVEQTYQGGPGGAIENLFAGLLRGIISGGVTAGVSNALEDLPLHKIPGLNKLMGGQNLGQHIGASTNPLFRASGKAVTSGLGGALGKGAELGFESVRGTYKGDGGDILVAMAQAGLHQTLQSFGEGLVEAPVQAIYNRKAEALRKAGNVLTLEELGQPVRSSSQRAGAAPDVPTAEAAPKAPRAPSIETTVRPAAEPGNVVSIDDARAARAPKPSDADVLPTQTTTDAGATSPPTPVVDADASDTTRARTRAQIAIESAQAERRRTVTTDE